MKVLLPAFYAACALLHVAHCRSTRCMPACPILHCALHIVNSGPVTTTFSCFTHADSYQPWRLIDRTEDIAALLTREVHPFPVHPFPPCSRAACSHLIPAQPAMPCRAPATAAAATAAAHTHPSAHATERNAGCWPASLPAWCRAVWTGGGLQRLPYAPKDGTPH